MDATNLEAGEARPLQIHFFVNFSHPSGTYFRFHNLAIGLTRLGHQVTVFGRTGMVLRCSCQKRAPIPGHAARSLRDGGIGAGRAGAGHPQAD
jgi:hypothetical protein